jgi:sugar fermentation stimulation protein A
MLVFCMQFSSTLLHGRLVRRYKRFFVDIELSDGTLITAHCPNTGSMQGVLTPGNPVWVSQSDDPKRKLKYTWELVEIDGTYVGVNTQNPNRIVGSALRSGYIPQLAAFTTLQAEVKYGAENSRIDYLLTDTDGNQCYVEVKNAHYAKIEQGHRVGIFPDSETTRGVKHLHELMRMVDQGHRAVLIYCLQRGDCESLRFGVEFDPVYAKTAVMALNHGVEMLPYSCAITLIGITLDKPLTLSVEIE